MNEWYNLEAMKRLKKVYPDAASGATKLIRAAEEHNAGSAEITLRYDKPEDGQLGTYDILLILRVQERSEQ